MANFSPSLQFSKRWRATPSVVKQTFYQELEDIIHMLGSEIPAKDYQFTNPDFGATVAELLKTHQDEPTAPTKLVHSIDTTPLHTTETSSATQETLSQETLADLETRITDKLSAQLDDFLGEHLAQLSTDLKAWIQTAVKNELADHQKSQ